MGTAIIICLTTILIVAAICLTCILVRLSDNNEKHLECENKKLKDALWTFEKWKDDVQNGFEGLKGDLSHFLDELNKLKNELKEYESKKRNERRDY